MFFPPPSTWKMVKDAHNHVPMKMIGLTHTSHEILKNSDVPIFPVVWITQDSLQLTGIVSVSHYSPSAWSLLEYGYVPHAQCPHATLAIVPTVGSYIECIILIIFHEQVSSLWRDGMQTLDHSGAI